MGFRPRGVLETRGRRSPYTESTCSCSSRYRRSMSGRSRDSGWLERTSPHVGCSATHPTSSPDLEWRGFGPRPYKCVVFHATLSGTTMRWRKSRVWSAELTSRFRQPVGQRRKSRVGPGQFLISILRRTREDGPSQSPVSPSRLRRQ